MKDIDSLATFFDTTFRTESFGQKTGLLIHGKKEVRRLMGCVNLSMSAIDHALDNDFDFIISHHAAWKSTDAELSNKKSELLRSAGISLYVSHDPLDAHPELGTAVCLAQLLKMNITQQFLGGTGVLAHNPMYGDVDAIAGELQDKVNPQIEIIKGSGQCRLAAIVSGWGARPEWMQMARELGADTFISGEAIHFGKLYAKETGMNLLLCGHYASEFPAIQRVTDRVQKLFDVEAISYFDRMSAELF